MNQEILEDHLFLGRRDRQVLNLFWFGFILYTASYTISTTDTVNYNVFQTFQIIGIFIFVPTAIHLMSYTIKNSYLQVLYTLYLIWLLVIVIRGVEFNYDSIKFILFDAWFGVFLYLVPLFLFLPKKLICYKQLFDVIIILGVIYIIYDFVYIKELMRAGQDLQSQAIVEYFSKTLATPSLFLLLTYRYHTFRRRVFSIGILVITLFFAVVRARRGLLLMELLPLVLVYLLYLSNNSSKFFIVLMSIFLGGFLIMFGMELFNAEQDGLFGNLMDRGLEDTRSLVETCFYQDMSVKDWLIGRGLMGEYFCPGIDVNEVTGYRGTIETDYLQLILKGGLISLSLFLLITIPAIFKGLFNSNNLLSKAAAMWIIWALIIMYPSTIHTFTMQYILLWIAVGICYSKTIRNIPEQILVDYFRGSKNTHEIAEDLQNQT
ncbi:hypothetical protein JM83_2574 [Gillisia sp. Hel_I_86]|uniref:hypothetical protein n=1 Tax=Gillisia sp. Hel_I_86 TaxID=1249981 RepID=UPI00119BF990|nr:hypothetical protein [Gillisia sp. Hel_I_86]TVZ27526.1 hypothetical protein JM83_2574 [Gillisia sp. Hel_I_86]